VTIELVSCEKNDENIRKLKYLGTLDNTIQSLHQKMTMFDCIKQMHASWLSLKRTCTTPEDLKAAWAIVKLEAESSMPFAGGTFNTFSQLAKVEDGVWALINQIFSGHYVVNKALKGQKAPTSLAHFNNMGNIPVDDLKRWLRRVCDGQWLTKTFYDRCQSYKKEVRVKEAILEYANVKSEIKFESYDDLENKVSTIGNPDWFASIVSWCDDKAKSKLPVSLHNTIDAALDATLEATKNAPQVSVFCVVVFVTNEVCFFFFFIWLILTKFCLLVPQVQTTSDDYFVIQVPIHNVTITVYHCDALNMANKIPKLPYCKIFFP
jgi:hypothetical protein